MTKYKTKKNYGRCKQWLLEKLFFGKRYNVNSCWYEIFWSHHNMFFDHIDYANDKYFLFNIRISWNYFGLFSVQSLEMRSFNRNVMSQVLNFGIEYSFWNYPLQNSKFKIRLFINSQCYRHALVNSRTVQFYFAPVFWSECSNIFFKYAMTT